MLLKSTKDFDFHQRNCSDGKDFDRFWEDLVEDILFDDVGAAVFRPQAKRPQVRPKITK
jgi:hypothetical protein